MIAQTLPDFCRSNRDINVAHAQMPQRIDNRIRDGCRGTHRGRLANPFRAQRMVRRWRASFVRLPLRRLDGRGHEVIHEAAALNIPDLIIADLFVHRWGKPHGQPTVDLAFDNHRINNIAAIIHRYETPNLDLSSSFVNIHYANVTAEWVCQVRRIVIRHRFEAGLEAVSYYDPPRSEEHTSELQSRVELVFRLLLEKKKK